MTDFDRYLRRILVIWFWFVYVIFVHYWFDILVILSLIFVIKWHYFVQQDDFDLEVITKIILFLLGVQSKIWLIKNNHKTEVIKSITDNRIHTIINKVSKRTTKCCLSGV